MTYVGETSMHLRIKQHRSDSNKCESSINYNKSQIESKHFSLRNFKNTTIQMLKIHKNVKEHSFLGSSSIWYYSATYPFGLNTDLFNKPVKSYSTLCLNFKHHYDCNAIYSQSNQFVY